MTIQHCVLFIGILIFYCTLFLKLNQVQRIEKKTKELKYIILLV